MSVISAGRDTRSMLGRARCGKWLSKSLLGEKTHAHITKNNNKSHLGVARWRVTKGSWEGKEIHDVMSSLAVLTGGVTLGKLLDLSVPLLSHVLRERERMNRILLESPNWFPQKGFVWLIEVLQFWLSYQDLKLQKLYRKLDIGAAGTR